MAALPEVPPPFSLVQVYGLWRVFLAALKTSDLQTLSTEILALVADLLAFKHSQRSSAISSVHQYMACLSRRGFPRDVDWSQAKTISTIVNVSNALVPALPGAAGSSCTFQKMTWVNLTMSSLFTFQRHGPSRDVDTLRCPS